MNPTTETKSTTPRQASQSALRPPASDQANRGPVLKGWMIRLFQAAGVPIPPDGEERERLAWLGVEMQRFLAFCRALPADTPLTTALEAYGRELKSRQPAPENWRLEQVREALRAFRRGSEGWQIIDGDKGPEVRFRTRSIPSAEDAPLVD